LAKYGGVVGVNFGSSFLSQKDGDELRKHVSQQSEMEPNLAGADQDAFAAKEHAHYDEVHPRVGNATVEDAAECMDHIVKVAGIDHVGIGSDFDGIASVPSGLEDVAKMPNLTAAWLKRGYSEKDMQKIMGGNFLHVVREVVGN
jgi:membrane dipeptidase